jgi:amino acid permease
MPVFFSKNYFYAVATLVGTIVGAGVFALPILVYSSGWLPFVLIFVALVFLQYFFHKMYAFVVLSSKGEHRVPGYAEKYFGRRFLKPVSIVVLLGGYGSLLAYLILGGIFAHELLSPFLGGSVLAYSLIFFFLEAIVVLFGLKSIAFFELAMSVLLLIVAGVISWRCFSSASPANYILADWRYLPLLYGPVFFSIGGDAAIPEVCRLLNKEKEKIKSALFWGTVIAGLIIAVFALAVVGATGPLTTEDSLSGLNRLLNGKVIYLALIFGLLNIATSMFTSMQSMREVYWWDFKMNKNVAYFLAALPPIVLFLFGAQNLTVVVGTTGALSGGILGVIMIYMARRVSASPEKKGSPIKISLPSLVAAALSLVFVAGFVYQLYSIFGGEK